jgi:hypothetical protein
MGETGLEPAATCVAGIVLADAEKPFTLTCWLAGRMLSGAHLALGIKMPPGACSTG